MMVILSRAVIFSLSMLGLSSHLIGQTSPTVQSLCPTITTAIQAGNLQGAQVLESQLLNVAFANIKADPLSTFEPTAIPTWSEATVDSAQLIWMVDQIVAAGKAGQSIRVRDLSMALVSATGALWRKTPPTPQDLLRSAEARYASAVSDLSRFLALPDLAEKQFRAGDYDKADQSASVALALAASHPKWPQGDAVFHGNQVKGLVALQQGNAAAASAYLLAAGKTTGSAVLGSFGPDMLLACQVLKKGDRATVLSFLSACNAFWPDNHGLLAKWIASVNAGGLPDFSPNVSY